MCKTLTIEEDNLSVAWVKALNSVAEEGEIAPLTVVLSGFSGGNPGEVPGIRRRLDEELSANAKGLSCGEVANTIFPKSLWNPSADRHHLYERYRRIMPRVLKDPRNRYGVYFQRLIAHGRNASNSEGVNQLEHVIETWHGGNHRRSALQAAIFDPQRDHTHQRMRGFPCLQQVAFAPQGANGFMVTGLYATQYIFERAYGNYLGLCRLGGFMAHEMGKQLTRVVCVANPATVGGQTKSYLRALASDMNEILES